MENSLEVAFIRAGGRMTRQRRKIIDFLESHKEDHPTIRQVFKAVNTLDGRISLATIYNTLGFLVRTGWVKVLNFDGSESRYEFNLGPHVNLICRKCGHILDSGPVPQIELPAIDVDAFQIEDSRFECYGVCNRCLQRPERAGVPADRAESLQGCHAGNN